MLGGCPFGDGADGKDDFFGIQRSIEDGGLEAEPCVGACDDDGFAGEVCSWFRDSIPFFDDEGEEVGLHIVETGR